MQKKQESTLFRYQLRHAAGMYWLLDMEQDIHQYKCPLSMNPMGADIWKRIIRGKSIEDIAMDLSKEYEADIVCIKKDVADFYQQLLDYGVITEE